MICMKLWKQDDIRIKKKVMNNKFHNTNILNGIKNHKIVPMYACFIISCVVY